MNRYRAGRAKEYAARKDLEHRGGYVIRSAGSKGLVDLVAIFLGVVWLVQVKYVQAGASWRDANWRKLFALSMPPHVTRVAYIYRRGVTAPTLVFAP